MSNVTGTLEDALEKAKKLDREVVRGDKFTLLINFDGDGQARYAEYRDLIDELFSIISETRWPSGSGQLAHEHLVIVCEREFTVSQRIALQAALGSDPKREILAVARQMDGDEGEVSLLFKPKNTPKALPATSELTLDDFDY